MRFGRGEGFYVSNGILNYRNDYKKRTNPPKKFIEYNLNHWDKGKFSLKHEGAGPISIGKFWVMVNNQYMFLPVYMVGEEKNGIEVEDTQTQSKFLYRACKKENLIYLKDFTKCIVLGLGGCYSVPNTDMPRFYIGFYYYPYIVKVSDIEEYKKEKFPKEKI